MFKKKNFLLDDSKDEQLSKRQIKRIKNKKPHTNIVLDLGRRRISIALLWALLGFASLFGIYRNFSAINTHTVVQEIEVRNHIQSTAGVESFVSRFGQLFFARHSENADRNAQEEALREFVSDDFGQLHFATLRERNSEVSVENITVWNAEQIDETYVEVTFSVQKLVTRQVEDTPQEIEFEEIFDDELDDYVLIPIISEATSRVAIVRTEQAYTLIVHVADDGAMVVTSMRFANAPARAIHERQLLRGTPVELEVRNDVEQFLHLFFEVYPTATQAQLHFYVENEAVEAIERELTFERFALLEMVQGDGVAIQAHVVASFTDDTTGMSFLSTHRLLLDLVGNRWLIVGTW